MAFALVQEPAGSTAASRRERLALASLETSLAELWEHRIAVITELAGGLRHVVGHEGQLRAVVVNIVQNAIDDSRR